MTSEITALRERIKQLEEDAETYAYKDQANFDLRSRIVTLESDNNRLTKERDTLKNKIKESGRYKLREQLAAAQATNERLREALQKGHRQLIYKLGGTYKDGYGGSDRDVEAAVLMYEALAIEPAQQEPLGVTEGTATPAGAAPLNAPPEASWTEAITACMESTIAELEQQRDELLVALEATVEAIRLFRNEPQLERLVSLRATAGYVAMDAAMDRGTAAIAKVKP